jgi:hypothetical protein
VVERPEPDRIGARRRVVARVLARDGRELDGAHAGGEGRRRLVEAHVAVTAEPEHREVDPLLLDDRGVTVRLGGGVGGAAVEHVHGGERDAVELRAQPGGERARVVRPDARVLRELDDGRLRARQLPKRRVLAQRLVHPARRSPGREQEPRARAGQQPVEDELGRHEPDALRSIDDERGMRRHRRSLPCPGMAGDRNTCRAHR